MSTTTAGRGKQRHKQQSGVLQTLSPHGSLIEVWCCLTECIQPWSRS